MSVVWSKLKVWHSDLYGGWAMACPSCGALPVRRSWVLVMTEVERHIAYHRRMLSYNNPTGKARPPRTI